LLHRSGIAASWDSRGLTNVVFLQDTNALVINGLLPALGVGEDEGFDMTSICVPRMPGEAAGAIVDLQNSADPSKSIVINVEYNQLDPLLNAQGLKDEPDEVTGYSAYPGNANNLVFKLKTYRKTIEGEDQGVVNEVSWWIEWWKVQASAGNLTLSADLSLSTARFSRRRSSSIQSSRRTRSPSRRQHVWNA
jgi:UDP-sugar pyrophosphorylase